MSEYIEILPSIKQAALTIYQADGDRPPRIEVNPKAEYNYLVRLIMDEVNRWLKWEHGETILNMSDNLKRVIEERDRLRAEVESLTAERDEWKWRTTKAEEDAGEEYTALKSRLSDAMEVVEELREKKSKLATGYAHQLEEEARLRKVVELMPRVIEMLDFLSGFSWWEDDMEIPWEENEPPNERSATLTGDICTALAKLEGRE